MPQPTHVVKIGLPDEDGLDADIRKYFGKCVEKLGLVPNVLRAYTPNAAKFRTFTAFYNQLMLDEETTRLTKLEREMIAVVVSSGRLAGVRGEQQAGVLDGAGGEHEEPGAHLEAVPGQRRRAHALDAAAVAALLQFDGIGVKVDGDVRRPAELVAKRRPEAPAGGVELAEAGQQPRARQRQRAQAGCVQRRERRLGVVAVRPMAQTACARR